MRGDLQAPRGRQRATVNQYLPLWARHRTANAFRGLTPTATCVRRVADLLAPRRSVSGTPIACDGRVAALATGVPSCATCHQNLGYCPLAKERANVGVPEAPPAIAVSTNSAAFGLPPCGGMFELPYPSVIGSSLSYGHPVGRKSHPFELSPSVAKRAR